MADTDSSRETAERYLIIVARQRSGTTVLRKMLATDPDTRVLGEVFSSKNSLGAHKKINEFTSGAQFDYTMADFDRFYEYYLSGFFERVASKTIVIDTKYNAFGPFTPYGRSPVDPPYFLEFACTRGFRIIHLVRQSILASLASEALAARTAVWHAYRNSEAERPLLKISFNASVLKKRMLRTLDEIELVRSVLQPSGRSIEIHYEELFTNGIFSTATVNTIQLLLDRPLKIEPVPTTIKISPPLECYLENYDEIAQSIRNDNELRARYMAVLAVDPLDVIGY